MAFLGGDTNVDILVSTNADTRGIDKTTASLSDLERQGTLGDKVMAGLGKTAQIASIALTAAAAAIGAGAISAIKSAGSYEQSRIAFDTMLGSAEQARKLMGEIADFAKTTPFELPDVVAGTKQLLAFGFAQEDLLPTMRKLGDLASGLGVPVGQLTNVFGQVRVAGRLMGQDLLQFTNAGVPLIEALATTMQKPQSEIKKLVEEGKVGFPEVQAAINSLTGEGSKFGGMMEKQSQTFDGVVSNIKDGFGQILRSAVGINSEGDIQEGSLFDRIKTAAEAALPVIQTIAEKINPFMTDIMDGFDKGGKAVALFIDSFAAGENTSEEGGIWQKIGDFATKAREIWDSIYNFLKPALDELWVTIRDDLLPTLQEFWANHGEQIKQVLGIIAKVLGGLFIGAIWLAINAIQIMVQIVSNWVSAIDTAMNFVKGYIEMAVNNFNWLKDTVKSIFDSVVGAVKWAWETIMGNLTRAKNWITDAWGFIVGLFQGIGTSISTALGNVYNFLTDPFQRAFDWISGLAGRIVGSIGNIGAMLRDAIGGWDIPGPLGLVRDVIPGFAKGVRNFSGGLAIVGEEGPELVRLPQGSDVYTNRESAAMANTTNNRSTSIQNVYLGDSGAVRQFFTELDSDMMLTMRGFTPMRGA